MFAKINNKQFCPVEVFRGRIRKWISRKLMNMAYQLESWAMWLKFFASKIDVPGKGLEPYHKGQPRSRNETRQEKKTVPHNVYLIGNTGVPLYGWPN